MKIAITMRVIKTQSYNEPRDAISHDWIKLMNKLNHSPILVSNFLENTVDFVKKQNVDAIIFSNGNDVGLGNYIKDSNDLSEERDNTEFKIMEYAVKEKIPVIGICRGMQFINVYFKGKLKKIENSKHVNCTHTVNILDEQLIKITGQAIEVNSFHNFGVYKKDISPDLKIIAISSTDNVVEGISHPSFPIYGIQWHPERTNPYNIKDFSIIDYLINRRY